MTDVLTHTSSLVVIGGWIALLLTLSVISRRLWPKQRELSRKIVHIGTGPIIPMAWWLQIPASLAIPVAAVVTLAALINHKWRLFAAVEDIQRNSYGTVAYALSITILLKLFWPTQAAAVCAGVMVMAFGDGLAGLIGARVNSPRWILFNQTKSVAGTLTMAIVSMAVLIGLNMISTNPVDPLRLVAVTCLAVGLEQISSWGVDNFSVPIAVALSWSSMTVY